MKSELLTQYNQCPYKKEETKTGTISFDDRGRNWNRFSCEARNVKDGWPSPEAWQKQGKILPYRFQRQPGPALWKSRLQNCETINLS